METVTLTLTAKIEQIKTGFDCIYINPVGETRLITVTQRTEDGAFMTGDGAKFTVQLRGLNDGFTLEDYGALRNVRRGVASSSFYAGLDDSNVFGKPTETIWGVKNCTIEQAQEWEAVLRIIGSEYQDITAEELSLAYKRTEAMAKASKPTPVSYPVTLVRFVRAQRLEVAGDTSSIPIKYSTVMEKVPYDK